ncbi:MAG TPA: FMN-binding glutamate synthase family protein [Bacillota bacterium]|nr:FMN-binding glutamate synthase family protein [Bacillota bacterium]
MGWSQGVTVGIFVGLIILVGGYFLLRLFIGWVFDQVFMRISMDPYWENLFATHNYAARFSSGEQVETELRSSTKPLPQRPFGARRILSPWDSIFFNPVYLDRLPLREANQVETAVVIGPAAARPLRVEIPILIGGMAYGTALSALAKQALAIGATKAGTATNTGNGACLEQERAAAERLIVQYSRSSWGTNPDLIRNANAVEIQFGQGAWGAAPVKVPVQRIMNHARLRQVLGISPKEPAEVSSRLPGVGCRSDLRSLVEELRGETNGVPIGVKIGATHRLEKELPNFLEAGVDFISIDGAEGGTHGGATVLDSVGIPTLHALVRARRFLNTHDSERAVSLLVGGGLTGPGSFLKALALGADAVFIGTAALLAVVHTQATKILPWEPPISLVFFEGKHSKRLNPFAGAESLARFLKNCVQEMRTIALVVGRDHLSEIKPSDLCSTNAKIAEWLEIPWVGSAPREEFDDTVKNQCY